MYMFLRRSLLIISFVGWVCLQSHAITLSNIVEGVTEESYTAFHTNLFVADGDSRGFTAGTSPRQPLPQHDLARDFIHSSFQTMGYDTWLDTFSFAYAGVTYTNANNIVAIKWGSEGTNIYILGAHYDSIDASQGITGFCPGADDNASGTAAILEVAKAIKDNVFRDTIIIVAFDAEEKDYKGSKHFVDTHITNTIGATNSMLFYKPQIKAMVNLDMIAYNDPANGDQIVLGSRKKNLINSPLSLALEQSVLSYTTLVPFIDGGYNASDHISFYDAGISTIHVIEHDLKDYWNNPPPFIENPHYHKTTDSIDQPGYISYPYATEVTKCITGYLCEQARAIPPATLIPAVATNSFNLSWTGTRGVAYNLYETDALNSSNVWNFIQYVAPTNVEALIEVQLDISSATQGMFKVLSE